MSLARRLVVKSYRSGSCAPLAVDHRSRSLCGNAIETLLAANVVASMAPSVICVAALVGIVVDEDRWGEVTYGTMFGPATS